MYEIIKNYLLLYTICELCLCNSVLSITIFTCIICIDCNHMLLLAIIPPLDIVTIEVTTTPYSAEISWVTQFIVLDEETYTIQYSTDSSLQNSSEVVIEAVNEFVINQKFSVNITELIPFTTYYYIIQADNSVGNTSTDVMTFTTSQTGIYVHINIT